MSFFKEYWDIILSFIWMGSSVVLAAIFQNALVLILNSISGLIILYIVVSRMGEEEFAKSSINEKGDKE